MYAESHFVQRKLPVYFGHWLQFVEVVQRKRELAEEAEEFKRWADVNGMLCFQLSIKIHVISKPEASICVCYIHLLTLYNV